MARRSLGQLAEADCYGTEVIESGYIGKARHSAVPDLRDVGPSSEVTTSFDPSLFSWRCTPRVQFAPRRFNVIVARNKTIRISCAVGRAIEGIAERDASGAYRVAIGIAPKALAIRFLAPDERGFKARHDTDGQSGLLICCAGVIEELARAGWKLPMALPAVVDRDQRMIVGRVLEDKPEQGRTAKGAAS